jgi:hypothetical protein
MTRPTAVANRRESTPRSHPIDKDASPVDIAGPTPLVLSRIDAGCDGPGRSIFFR